MNGPHWVPIGVVITIHDRQISRHGGAAGIRDLGLLETGCARPLNRHVYEGGDVATLAAAYAFGIAKAHAFVDGNKRTAFVTAATFLEANGLKFRPDRVEGVKMMEALASSEMTEDAFAGWLRAGAVPL